MPGRTYQTGSGSYRYSINGQEKSDELNPNLTTAEYWEYDSRLGRRWNRDPKALANKTPYSTFSNDPLIQIDIKGDDDVWSIDKRTGKITLISSTNTGHDIYVLMGDQPVLLSDIEINWKNKSLVNGLADISVRLILSLMGIVKMRMVFLLEE